MAIHKTSSGGYVISSRRTWLPGSYADERTARYAFRFKDEELQALQDSVNPGGVITYEMLKNLKSTRLTD
ncbi:MAG: hypothetical protein JWN34_1533 [Bryobacterales bacterium]|nr:hypothetical protein [Bryobacterales bacterium]